jgi:hypothetical protein
MYVASVAQRTFETLVTLVLLSTRGVQRFFEPAMPLPAFDLHEAERLLRLTANPLARSRAHTMR